MSPMKIVVVVLVASVVWLGGLGLAERLAGPGEATLVTPAHALIGRPLTPLSVAGVARRTVVRCAAGVLVC